MPALVLACLTVSTVPVLVLACLKRATTLAGTHTGEYHHLFTHT